MKSIFKFSNLAFLAVMVLFTLSSCGGDDEIIIDPGPVGIPVADGFYMAAAGVDPTSTDALVAEKVTDGFGSQDRAGFIGNYIYLSGGTYNIVEITDKAIASTWGGTTTTVDDAQSPDCGFNEYTLIEELTEDGAGIAITEGLYKVNYDSETKDLILHKIETAAIIGSATPLGWDADTKLENTALASGGASWTASDVEMRAGAYKFRMNCRWSIARKVDPDGGDEFENGYSIFINMGGAADNVTIGGGDIDFPASDEGIYTITLIWTPETGFSAALEKTGDVMVIDFVPDDHKWAITGDATANGWANDDPDDDPIGVDIDMTYDGLNGTDYTWSMQTIDFGVGGFKFRTNDAWTENLGYNDVTLSGDVSDFTVNGDGNFVVGTAATYKIILTTKDGNTYTADFEQL